MSGPNEPSVRIDWFDGSIVESSRPTLATTSQSDEIIPDSWEDAAPQPPKNTNKMLKFKDLVLISEQEASNIILRLSEDDNFWALLNSDFKNDFFILLVKIFAKLFRSLKTNDNSFVLRTLVNEKFFSSEFIVKLKDFMSIVVAKVKGNNGRAKNVLFWNDTPSFFGNVVDICIGMSEFDKMGCETALDLLRASHLCVQNAISNYVEHIEYFLLEIEEMQKWITDKMNNETPAEQTFNFFDTNPVLGHFNIFPTYNDIFHPVDIEPNIINGSYTSVNHYLELQIKLLKEDYIGPLREGIFQYQANPRASIDNLRVYNNVRFVKTVLRVVNHQIGYLVKLEGIKEKKTKNRFMIGSLLLFTCNGFKDVLCATVLIAEEYLLEQDYIIVTLHTPTTYDVYHNIYNMFESNVFFEPYHWVMKVLQHYGGKDVPMCKYIVHVKPDTKPPDYLKRGTMYCIPSQGENEGQPFSVLGTDKYPEDCFNFDQSQLEAFKLALTREFALIQGPPGTGKSFIGNAIATTILKNVSLQGSPILVICYTNHALDQFLEGMAKVTQNMIRLGSQSKNPNIMGHFTLAKYKKRFGRRRVLDESGLQSIIQKIESFRELLEKCDGVLLEYNTIKDFLRIGSKKYFLNDSDVEDPVIVWLFGEVIENENPYVDIDDSSEVEIKEIHACLEVKDIEVVDEAAILNQARLLSDDESKVRAFLQKYKDRIEKANSMITTLKEKSDELDNSQIFNKTLPEVTDLYKLNTDERWILYFQTVDQIRKNLMERMMSLQEDYQKFLMYKDEITAKCDAYIMKHASIVGVTTSGAARRHTLLQELKPQIVIVEEAGEVFESHIVAALTRHCKHLILIGDHKQLRPTAANYVLAKKHNIEISLFERMLRNGIHARSLTIQRRMRPIFVDLLVPKLYERLDSHPKVSGYSPIQGMKKDLFFFNHTSFEDSMGEGYSHKNTFEAHWCVALAHYLTLQKYEPQDITILSMYNGQADLIFKLILRNPALRKCQITVVDNYQGEENRIVILSLVRSNRDNNIGFLSAANRVCVALSRAKEGFYIFGNMDVLSRASPLWRSIHQKLIEKCAIGDTLTVCCNKHEDITMTIKKADELKSCTDGNCLKVCQSSQ